MAMSESGRRAAVWLAVCMAFVPAGCSSTSPGAGRSPSSTPSATPSDTTSGTTSATPSGTADARTIAVNTYLAMWADVVEAAKTSDYDSPRLADHADMQALLLMTGALRSAHQNKVVAKGTPRFSPQVTKVTPPDNPIAVSLKDCVDGRDWLNYRLDGRLQNDVPGGHRLTTATVGLLKGRWVVTRLEIGKAGTCR
jgi:hypothetical protein